MKILLDANISWKLIELIKPAFPDCLHADHIGLAFPAKDIEIWHYAKENNCIIITKDSDFVSLLEINGYPPKIILLKTGNCKNNALAEVIIKAENGIKDFVESDCGLLEII
jgi:predicted nuclease of predicted toxin-antitoxin system